MIELFDKKKTYIKINEKLISLTRKKKKVDKNYSVIGNKIGYLENVVDENTKDTIYTYMKVLLGKDIKNFTVFYLENDLFLLRYLSYNEDLKIFEVVDRDSADFELMIHVSTF